MRTTNYYRGTAVAGRWAIAVLLALGALAPAQEKIAPGTAPAPATAGASAPDPVANAVTPAVPAAPQTEMEKWIANTDAKWQAAYKHDITDLYEEELKKVSAQYSAGLEAAFKKASAAGDLDASLALRNEEKRFADAKSVPEQDESTDAAAVKEARAAYRTQIARSEKDKTARTVALQAKYDQALAQAQAQLTQHARLEDALLVKKKREEVAAAWLAGVAAPQAPAPDSQLSQPPQSPAAVAPRAPVAASAASAAEAATGNLFKNPNFENGTDGWEPLFYQKTGTVTVDKDELHEGKPSLRIDNGKGDVTFVRQLVGKPNTHYRLTGYVKTKGVEAVKKGGEGGANLESDSPLECATLLQRRYRRRQRGRKSASSLGRPKRLKSE